MQLELKVFRFSAPRGAFTGSETVWNVPSDSLQDPATALMLRDNGVRVAVGRASERDPLKVALDGIDGLLTATDAARPDPSRDIELTLGPCTRELSLFVHEPGGGLVGRDFLDATAKLGIRLEMRSVAERRLDVHVVPELEEPPGPPKWVIEEGVARQVPQDRSHVYSRLGFTAELTEGGFILMGPTPTVYDLPLLGRALFVETVMAETSENEERESIYIIRPVIRYLEE